MAYSGYWVAKLPRPYDYRVLIETYIYTKRGFVHTDFSTYYSALLRALENEFGIRLSRDGLSFDQSGLWSLFEGTVRSLLQITHPFAGYLEATLLYKQIEKHGEVGKRVMEASKTIGEAGGVSAQAHHEMLEALLFAIFGEMNRIVTSEDLQRAGFDDSKEPNISDYYDSF